MQKAEDKTMEGRAGQTARTGLMEPAICFPLPWRGVPFMSTSCMHQMRDGRAITGWHMAVMHAMTGTIQREPPMEGKRRLTCCLNCAHQRHMPIMPTPPNEQCGGQSRYLSNCDF